MKLIDLMNEWKTDSKFDLLNIEKELSRVPELHEKYLNIMVESSILMKNLQRQFYSLRKDKRLYYSGAMDIEEIKERGWDQIDRMILKSNIEDYLLADEDLNKISSKIDIQNEIVEYCKLVLKEISTRTWQIRSLIDYRKYQAGI